MSTNALVSEFPRGPRRLGIALVIWASAAFAGWESWQKFVSRAGTTHLGVGMVAAVLGMIGNFAVSKYKAHVARRIQSMTLQAEAQHSWLDVMSSLGALVGLFAVALGYRRGDPLRVDSLPYSSVTWAGRSPPRSFTTSWTAWSPSTS